MVAGKVFRRLLQSEMRLASCRVSRDSRNCILVEAQDLLPRRFESGHRIDRPRPRLGASRGGSRGAECSQAARNTSRPAVRGGLVRSRRPASRARAARRAQVHSATPPRERIATPRSYQTSSPPVSRNFPLGPCSRSATRTISAAPSFTVC